MDNEKKEQTMDTQEKTFDITNFDQGPREIIKYMDYLPDDDEVRLNFLMGFMNKATGI